MPHSVYDRIGRPTLVQVILYGNDCLITPGNEFKVVRNKNGFLYVLIEVKDFDLEIKRGRFPAETDFTMGRPIYRITGCAKYAHDTFKSLRGDHGQI